uniref:Uncharacterized protein n=1 Tax=Rhizophora mucronata TaxID=61149 RepID=A0A2P2NMG8_RHIMU
MLQDQICVLVRSLLLIDLLPLLAHKV